MTEARLPTRRGSAFLTAALLATSLTIQGCAVDYVDGQGRRHVVGFVDYTVPAPADGRLAGDMTVVSAYGLSWFSHPRQSGVALGYSRLSTASFLDNALALGPFDRLAANEPKQANRE